MDKAKITVITVCYNAEDTIEKTIQSILGQNYPNLEYIIVDGSSTDSTMRIVNKYACDTMRVVSEPDKGISDAFNKGINMATGEMIGLINADDQLAAGALESINKAYQESGADVIYGDTITIDAENNLRMYKKAGKPEELKYCMPFIHQSAFVSKNAYEKLAIGGGYSSEYKICMDYDLMAGLYQKNATFTYTNSVISIFYYGGTSCKHPLRTITENMRIAAKYGLGRKEVFLYKARVIPINLLKLVLTRLGLWNRLYRVMKEDMIL